jgi:CrcB protein
VNLLLVLLGAAVGAPVRYLADRAVMHRVQSLAVGIFPWGTLAVNLAGSFLLGMLFAATSPADGQARLALGTGFCGALSTYSTFSYETLRLAEDGAVALAWANVLVSVTVGVAAALLGTLVGVLL